MAKDEYAPFTGKLDAAPQFEPFDGTLDGEKPGIAARLKQGASRAIDSASTALTDDPDKIAKIAAEQARTALPQTETQRKMAEEIAPYSDAAAKAEGVVDNVKAWGTLGFKRAGQLISNPAEAGKMIAEQLPNSLPGLAGGFAGAKAGAALGTAVAPGVGTVIGGIAGGLAGGFAGGYGLEKGASVQEQVQQQAQERGIDVRNEAEVSKMLQQSYPEIEAAAQRKGVGTAGTDAALNVATMGLAGLGGRTLAKEARTLAEGVKSGAISAADAATDLARLEAASAARNTLKAQALRGTGVVGAEMAGEGISEAVGQKFAYGEVNPGEVVDEALLGLGSGGAMALGSKAFNKAAGVVDQDATARDLAQVRDALGEPSQPSEVPQDTAQPQPDMSPPLALPAPVIDVAQDGTARTAADRNSRLSRIADGDVTDVTPVPSADAARESGSGAEVDIQAPAEVEAPRSVAMGLDPAHGPLTAGAALAVDTGVTGQMQQAAALTQAAELAKKTGAAPQEQKQPAAKQALSPEEEAGLASTLAGSDLVNGSIESSAASELQAKLNEVQQRAAENGSWNVPLMAQRKRIEDAMAKLQATAVPPNPTSPQGVTDGPQASQAQQDRAQPAQVGAAPAVARAAPDAQGIAGPQDAGAAGVANGSTTPENPGAQAAAAPGPQAAPAAETRAQRVASAGEAWTRMPTVERQALAQRTDLKPIARKNVHGAAWESLSGDIQRKLAEAMEPASQAQEDRIAGRRAGVEAAAPAQPRNVGDLRALAAQFRERHQQSENDTDRTFAAVIDQFAEDIEQGKRTREGFAAAEARYREILGRPAGRADAATAPEQPVPQQPATHQDPGAAPEAVTPAVVAKSVKTAARNEDAKPSEMRKWLVGEIDQAAASAPEAATGYLTFDVPGDGTFKVLNSRERLQEFRKNVMASPGFKDRGQAQAGPQEQLDSARNGSGGTVEAIRNFLSDSDVQGAVEYARLKGVEFTLVAPQLVLSPKGKARSLPASVKSKPAGVAEGVTQVEAEQLHQYLTAEKAKAEPAAQQSAQDFIPAPDGGLDYGEITPEMGKAMRRQAGKIRLQQGVQNSDGTGHGLAHIEANHGEQIRGLGFDGVADFVARVAGSIQQVWQVPGNSQLLVTVKDGRKDVMYIQLEIAKDGDFYRVNSAFPVRQQDYEARQGMKKIWDGSEPTSAVTGQRPAFATAAIAAPDSESSQGSSNARGQNSSVPATAQQDKPQPITRADVDAARRQAATLIGERIDAMSAGDVNQIAKKFLPTMGMKPTVSKERNKVMLTDVGRNMNLEAAAAELEVELPADVRRALDADTQGLVDAVKDDGMSPKRTAAQPAAIEDAGEKIGGARKDRWKERGLDLSDLDAMTEAEGAELATKANVWKPDYEALSEASEPVTAAMVKIIYDQLAAKPKKNTPEGRRQYVQMMRIVRDVYTEAKGPEAVKNAYLEIRKRAGLNTMDPQAKAAARELLFSVYKGRSDPFVLGYTELAKAKKMVEDGFPSKAAPWKSRLVVGRREGGNGTTERGIEMYMELSAEVGTPLTREQIEAGFFRVQDKKNKTVAFAASKEDAEAAAATVYERDMKGGKDGKPEPVRPNLDELKRENLPQRIDRDVTTEDFISDLGFRGVEFGNWSAQDERQRIINMAYDGLMDLAEIMGVPPKAMSLNGTLGMAFGARGGGRFAAHYEPGKLVINMTKIRGGGSMAHEWAHAMDHYFGELDKADAYTTAARGASGWYSEGQYSGKPITRHERVGNEWKAVEKMRLENLRPEMAAAFDEVMRALFSKQVTKAEMVRSHELDLERTEALEAKEQASDLKAMYQNMAQNKRQALNELRGDPEGTMYAGRGRTEYANQAQALSGKSVDGYWVRPTEMFARAFESWVFDRVTAMGARSDYLVHGVEEDRFAGGAYKGNPYPTGEERARINAAFDKLAQTIKTKKTGQGVAMFSRSSESVPQSAAEWLSDTVIADEVEKRIGGFAQQPPIRIRDTAFGQLPGVARNDNVAGAVHDGAIYLFRDQLGDRAAVQRTLFHELFHYGLRKFLTKEQFTGQMMDLYRRDKAIKDEADRWAATADGQRAKEFGGSEYALARGVDEALAILAEPNGGPHLNQTARAMFVRRVANWLADVAQFLKMDKAAAYLRSIHNSEARAYIQSIFKRLEADVGGNGSDWSEAGGPAFSRATTADLPSDGAAVGAGFNVDGFLSTMARSAAATKAAGATDRAIMDMVRDGRAAPDILRLVAGASKSRFNRKVARLLLKTGAAPSVELVRADLGSSDGFQFLGKYSRKNDKMTLTPGAEPQAEHIFMHEYIHAATLRALDRKGLASLQMRRLYEHVKRQGDATGHYGMKNVGEFVAEAFTNPEFQRALRGITAPPGGTLKTAWDGFVRILRSILGLPQDGHDALSRALELGVAVMREDKALRQRGAERRQAGDAFVQSPQTRATYEGRIDALFNGGKAQVGTAVLDRSDVMGLLGHPDVPLMLNERHLLDGLTNHPEMTAAAWKKVPGWLENPAAVFTDPNHPGRMMVIAPERIAGYPVLMAVEPNAGNPVRGKSGSVPSEQLLVTVFAKTTGELPALGYLGASGRLLYADTKKAPEVWRRAGVNPQTGLQPGPRAGDIPRAGGPTSGAKKILTEKHLNGWRKAHADKPSGTTDFDATASGALPSNARSDAGEDAIVSQQGADGQSEGDEAFFGAADLGALKSSALDQLHRTLSHPGKVSLWDKTVGTMRHLGERSPAFKPVYQAAQRFIDDVSMLGNDAADRAPRLLPRVETLADLKKKPITPADNKAVGKPLFEGTLLWARDVDGTPVTTEALNAKYRNATPDEKAQILLRTGKIQAQMLKVWRGLPVDQFNAIINNKFDSTILKPGVVWSAKELAELFGLNDQQASLYQEARKAIDRSIDMTARADMLRMMGDEYASMREVVLEQASMQDAMVLLTDALQADARENPDQADRLMGLNNSVVKSYERAVSLQEAGYAPLSRFGRYTVDVVSPDGTREYFGMFESMPDSNKMKAAMEKEFPGATVTQGTMSDEAYKLFAGITPESLEQFGGMLGLKSDGATAQDKAFQAYLQLAKNNHSALKRLIHRKGIAGYSEDVGRVLASFVYSNARLAAGGLNAGTLEAAIEAIPKEQGELRDVAMGLRSYIQDPQEEGQAVRGMLFAQYLGGSVASALVNMTQPFQITMPWLSQFGGMRKAGAHLGAALRDMARGGKYEPDLAQALHAAQEDGVVSPQEIHQLMAQARGTGSLRVGDGTRLGDARAAAANNWERVKVAWGQPFALAEQFNRRSTFIAAYRLAKEQGMAAPAEFARRAVLETQFVYSKANKPKWARGAIGGTLFTFKTYSVSYLELMQRMWTQGGPEGKRAVGWAVAMLLLMSGAGGLPFMEDAEDLIDGAGQLMGYNVSTKQWRKQMLRDTLGKELADFVDQGVSGLPGAPIDVSGRLGMQNLLPGTGLLLSKQSRERDLLEIAGPAGDLVARGFKGARKALTGDLAGAALEVSPAAVRNAAKGIDMATSGIYKDTKGYKVMDTTLDEAIFKTLGFQPHSVAEDSQATAYKQRMKTFYTQTSGEIKAQWADALFRKDEGDLQRVRERLADWNRDNPDQPIVVKMPDVWKRVREMGKDRTQRIADTAPKALRNQMREMARENG